MRYIILFLISLNCYASVVTCYFPTEKVIFRDIKTVDSIDKFPSLPVYDLNKGEIFIPMTSCIIDKRIRDSK